MEPLSRFAPMAEASSSEPLDSGLVRATAPGSAATGTELTDDLVRAAAGALSHHPALMSWLVTDDLAQRLVAAIGAVADGYSPREELRFARPTQPFFVRHDGGQPVITSATFRRYDLAVEAATSLDPDGVVDAYQRLRPRLEQIHGALPYARGSLGDRLDEAIDHLLATPVPAAPYPVRRQTRTWAFADPRLEGLSDAQRHLLRTGPANARRIQIWLGEVREALEARPAIEDEPGAAAAVTG